MPRMDGEGLSETSTHIPGEGAGERGENPAGSGWTSTKQAAKVLGVSRRSVQGYVRRGILKAREEGKGVNKRFFVSIDSLNALRERRRGEALAADDFADASSDLEEAANLAAKAGEGLRHVVDRLEARTVEATEFRVRLEITERAESTLREELSEERRRREEAERRADELERQLRERQEAPQAPETGAPTRDPTTPPAGSHAATEAPVRATSRPWWRRVFGG